MLKNACWLYCQTLIHRYLMANAQGRWDGAEKAQRHRELCCFYVAAHVGLSDPDGALLCVSEYQAVHEATQELTDRMDEVIGFPLSGRPDYDTLAPLFFERFHALAMAALGHNDQNQGRR